jgi:chromosome partitioning protein
VATIIAVANASGSAGKTTTVVTLADLIGRTRSVVVVDADAQGTATSWLGYQPDAVQTTLGDVLLRRATLDQAVLPTRTKGVRLIPSNRTLDAAAIELNSVIGREQRLRLALAGIDTDVVLIDCPGSVSTITISALVAANSILTVTQPTMKEIAGVPEMLDAVQAVQEAFNPNLVFTGIVPCIVPPATHGKIYSDVMGLLHSTYQPLVAPAVRRSARVAEAHAQAVPLPTWSPTDKVTSDYQEVHSWLKGRGVL